MSDKTDQVYCYLDYNNKCVNYVEQKIGTDAQQPSNMNSLLLCPAMGCLCGEFTTSDDFNQFFI